MSSEDPDGTRGGFHIVSWNVNGLRTLRMSEVLHKRLGREPHILAVQETKLTRGQLEDSQALVDNYTSYFAFSKNRAGYSGVATYCRNDATPVKAEDGLGGTNLNKELEIAVGSYCDIGDLEYADAKFGDNDGRCVITQHVVVDPKGIERILNVINVYCPRWRDDPSDPVNNTQFKQTFHNLLGQRAQNMIKKEQFVLVVGDVNISHTILDQSEVEDQKQFLHTPFRKWLDDILSTDRNNLRLVDTFRAIHPDTRGSFTCWNTRLNSRENNYGARIDYILADLKLSEYLKDADVHQTIMGSDHCPISATFHSLTLKPQSQPPQFASKYYPEFSGKQQKLLDLLIKRNESSEPQREVPKTESSGIKRPNKPSPKQTSLSSFFIKKPKLEPTVSFSKFDASDTASKVSGEDSGGTGSVGSAFFQDLNTEATQAWRQLLKAPETTLCSGHNEKCVLRTVRKQGIHRGRQFWACPRGQGKPDDPNSNCNFFKWASGSKS